MKPTDTQTFPEFTAGLALALSATLDAPRQDGDWRRELTLADGSRLFIRKDKNRAELSPMVPAGFQGYRAPQKGNADSITAALDGGPARLANRALALLAPGGDWQLALESWGESMTQQAAAIAAMESTAAALASQGVRISRHSAEPSFHAQTAAGSYVSGRVMQGGDVHLTHATLKPAEIAALFSALGPVA